jgi:uncharacterized repeat protein (TIGR03943 family)
VRGLAIAAWGGFFVYLWASGRATTYIGPKTTWVVTLGAIGLPLVALAYLASARRERRVASVRELGANGLLIAPILFALMVPAPSLGALAVKNKGSANAPPVLAAPPDGQVRLFEIAWAQESDKYAGESGVSAGAPVDFVGFVSQDKLPGGRIELSRFYVGCCAADAAAYSIKLKTPTTFPIDTWVRVQGTLTGEPGRNLDVAVTSIDEVAQPDNPYN